MAVAPVVSAIPQRTDQPSLLLECEQKWFRLPWAGKISTESDEDYKLTIFGAIEGYLEGSYSQIRQPLRRIAPLVRSGYTPDYTRLP